MSYFRHVHTTCDSATNDKKSEKTFKYIIFLKGGYVQVLRTFVGL